MAVIQLEKPAFPALLLAEVKAYLAITHEEQDALIGDLIGAATAVAELYTGLALLARQVEVMLDMTQDMTTDIPYRPILSADSLHWLGRDGSRTVIPADQWYCETGQAPRITLLSGTGGLLDRASAPSRRYVLTARAGFGETWNDLPDDIRLALKRLVAHSYQHRGDMESGGATVSDLAEASGSATLLRRWRRVTL